MANTKKDSSGACPCSQKINRRGFLKAAAAAGALAGCGKALETPAPTQQPTVTETAKPTVDPRRTEVSDLTGKQAIYILPRETYAVQCHGESFDVLNACGVGITLAAPLAGVQVAAAMAAAVISDLPKIRPKKVEKVMVVSTVTTPSATEAEASCASFRLMA